jgi:putative SOS response-associated peptidase YedK
MMGKKENSCLGWGDLMCGRFSLAMDFNLLQEKFRFTFPDEWNPRYNIAPSQPVLTVTRQGNRRVGQPMRWGLVPFWAKDPKIGYKMINARAETLDERPAYKHPFRKQRCLIPADGFYEWKRSGKTKQPYRFQIKGGEPFAFAGLWDQWKQGTDFLYTCTIITTRPNALVGEVHNRMPVILREDDYETWLDPEMNNPVVLQSLLEPYPEEQMESYPVSQRVNSPKNDDPSLIEPAVQG